MKRNLLLVSSSRVHGYEFLEHVRTAIKSHFKGAKVLFVPYALSDHNGYEQIVAEAFNQIGLTIESIHHAPNPLEAIEEADGIFIGGGNSFRLLKTLYELAIVEPIRKFVAAGKPYMGSSAGTNMSCPTIRTTNDMPIVEPPSLNSLGLIPFQINPHFLDADPSSTHKGETREQRLAEYLEENSIPVLGIREGSWLEISDNQCTLRGKTGAAFFAQNEPQKEFGEGTNLSWLLQD